MIESSIIVNEKDAREAKATVSEIADALSSDQHFASIVAGLSLEVVNGYRRALLAQKFDLQTVIDAYEHAKEGEFSALIKRAGADLGLSLIVARIVKGYSQKELARRLGIKEQQIQRYEAERYRSISLSNYRRIAHALGVTLEAKIPAEGQFARATSQAVTNDYHAEEIKKIIKHAREHKWFESNDKNETEEESYSYLQRYISDHLINYGSPALLRTGLNTEELANDLALVAWKSRVTRLAEAVIGDLRLEYSSLDISWLSQLTQLSREEDGPAKAKDFLLSHGIVLIVEPQITGLPLDGAAFLVGGYPIIGLTLRRDSIDNFWFTLLHELAHIILHYRMGLSIGFFDDTERTGIDEIEQEANEFASNLLIPNERWKRSAARITKSSEPIEKFAQELKIHSAIVFGRIRKERGDYATFSNKIGRGSVRKWFL